MQSNSIACANIMLNAAVAESLKIYADRLEAAEDFQTTLHEMIRKTIKDHKRIIFNGNGYDDAWIKEATEKRGLLNLRTTPDAIPMLVQKDNMAMLVRHKVFTESELRSRYEIQLENYCKIVRIEALTMVDIAKKQIIPAVASYVSSLVSVAAQKKALDTAVPCGYEQKLIRHLSALVDAMDARTDALEQALTKFDAMTDVTEQAFYIRDAIIGKMGELRAAADEAETMTAESYWPFPTYGDLLFGVQ